MKISIYVLREHIAPFFFALFIITFLFIIDFLVKLLDAILSKGLEIRVVLEIFVLNMAWMLALSIPMSCLVASLMAFGRLSGDNEITAMRASGISPLQVLLPVFLTACLLCAGLIYFNNQILPEANHRAAALRNDITRKKAPAFINPGILIKEFPNYRIWVDSINYKTNLLYGVKIYFWERQQPPRYMYAARAEMKYTAGGKKILIRLMEGENHIVDNKNTERYLRLKFKSQTVAIDNVDASLARRERHTRSDREMSVSQMYEVIRDSEKRMANYRRDYPEKIFNPMTDLDSLLKGDSGVAVPPRLLEQPWWKAYPVSSVFYRRLRNLEKEKLYLINRFEQKMNSERKYASKYLVEIHKKYSIPVACIIFVLVGGPLGILARRGGIGMGSIISSGFFLVYWVGLLRGEAMADRLIISPWVSMWAPNILVGVVGVWLSVRTLRVKG